MTPTASDGPGTSRACGYRPAHRSLGRSIGDEGGVAAAYWPNNWPVRAGKNSAYVVLYVMFDFINPAIEVGFSIPGAGAAATRAAWPTVVPAAVAAVRCLHRGYELVSDSGDLAAPTATIATQVVDADWFDDRTGAMTGSGRVRLRRRDANPMTATVKQVHDMLIELRDDIASMGAGWWGLVSSLGYIKL